MASVPVCSIFFFTSSKSIPGPIGLEIVSEISWAISCCSAISAIRSSMLSTPLENNRTERCEQYIGLKLGTGMAKIRLIRLEIRWFLFHTNSIWCSNVYSSFWQWTRRFPALLIRFIHCSRLFWSTGLGQSINHASSLMLSGSKGQLTPDLKPLTCFRVFSSLPWQQCPCFWELQCWCWHSQELPSGTQWWTMFRRSGSAALHIAFSSSGPGEPLWERRIKYG